MSSITEEFMALNKINLKYKRTLARIKSNKVKSSASSLFDFDDMYNSIVILYNDGVKIGQLLIKICTDAVNKKDTGSIKNCIDSFKLVAENYCVVSEQIVNVLLSMQGITSRISDISVKTAKAKLTLSHGDSDRSNNKLLPSSINKIANLASGTMSKRELSKDIISTYNKKIGKIVSLLNTKKTSIDEPSAEQVKLLSKIISFITTLNEIVFEHYSTLKQEQHIDENSIDYIVTVLENVIEEIGSLLKQVKNLVPTNY